MVAISPPSHSVPVRIKICGITRLEDAMMAIDSGANALGFVFYPASARNITIDQACSIMTALPPFVTTVALFVDADADFVEQVIARCKVDLLQFHGQEPEAFCAQFSRPYIKAIRMQAQTDLLAISQTYHSAQGWLLDAYVKGVPGGTGATFNWQWLSNLPMDIRQKLILAGGLNADNVGTALREVRPYAVDVSGGVEQAPGQKSLLKIQQFIQACWPDYLDKKG